MLKTILQTTLVAWLFWWLAGEQAFWFWWVWFTAFGLSARMVGGVIRFLGRGGGGWKTWGRSLSPLNRALVPALGAICGVTRRKAGAVCRLFGLCRAAPGTRALWCAPGIWWRMRI